MSFQVEWKHLDPDYPMAIVITDMGHRCGYVGVPERHQWSGKDYGYKTQFKLSEAATQSTNPIGTFVAAFELGADGEEALKDISYAANVHGGVTYARKGGSSPLEDSSDWWFFGFDAAHSGDDEPGGRSLEYMRQECTKLRDFLKQNEVAA